MKNYKVKVTRNFTDSITGQNRVVGDEFVCVEDRYNFLKANNAVELIEAVEEVEIEAVEETVEEIIIEEKSNKKDKKNKRK